MGEKSTSENSNGENNYRYEVLKSSYEEQENSENEANRRIKRMNELENHLEAIAHRSDLQEVGIVRPYLVE